MSILIKGIEMPNPGQIVLFEIDENGDVFAAYDGGRTKMTQHKAVPVPPHGRLIDADGEIGVNVTMMPGGKCRVDLIAPTIIPAEEGKNTNTWPEYRTQVLGTQKETKEKICLKY